MPPTIATARESFVAAVRRDTPGTDLPRLVAVLDALIAWSVERRPALVFQPNEKRPDQITFGRAKGSPATWSALVTLGEGPRLELILPSGQDPTDVANREMVMAELNARSRAVLETGDRLRISFGALKNAAALAAVLGLMDRVLESKGGPIAASPDESGRSAADAADAVAVG